MQNSLNAILLVSPLLVTPRSSGHVVGCSASLSGALLYTVNGSLPESRQSSRGSAPL